MDIQTQWILLFFVYCFAGWLWECCYVSVRKRQWINRGFLQGPCLPIYGSGACLILLITLPVRNSIALTFLIGMLGATALEYAVGAAMEQMFQTRYWDYSDQPLNLNGHICLSSSLCWGVFSVLLVRVIHPPIRSLVYSIPVVAAVPLSHLFSILFAVDTTCSVRTALDLKALMVSLTAGNQTIEMAVEHLEELAKALSRDAVPLRERLQTMESALTEVAEEARQKNAARREQMLERMEKHRDHRAQKLALLEEHRMELLHETQMRFADGVTERERAFLNEQEQILENLQASIQRAQQEIAARRQNDLHHVTKLLSRNPSAVSRQHRRAMEELSELLRSKK